LITSIPHACEKVKAVEIVGFGSQEIVGFGSREIVGFGSREIVGFGSREIKEFVTHSFANGIETVREFFLQLNNYPHIHSICSIPINLEIIVDIFQVKERKLPSTLYWLFTAMVLQRKIEKGNRKASSVQSPTPNEFIIYRTLKKKL